MSKLQDIIYPTHLDAPPRSFDLERMLREIDNIVSNDWAYSVTDDMIELRNGEYRKFTQKQAEEMATALSKIFMIAHCIDCNACGNKYLISKVETKKQ